MNLSLGVARISSYIHIDSWIYAKGCGNWGIGVQIHICVLKNYDYLGSLKFYCIFQTAHWTSCYLKDSVTKNMNFYHPSSQYISCPTMVHSLALWKDEKALVLSVLLLYALNPPVFQSEGRNPWNQHVVIIQSCGSSARQKYYVHIVQFTEITKYFVQ